MSKKVSKVLKRNWNVAVVILSVILSVIIVAAPWDTRVARATEKEEVPNREREQNKGPEGAVDSHAAHVRSHFQDPEMDFVFGSLVLGATVNHGCEFGEAFYTAANIKDGDASSWQEQWIRTARLVEARGEKSLVAGHPVSAREQFQRSSYYYRASLVSMLPDDPRFRETGQ
jgi:hypothetical protein